MQPDGRARKGGGAVLTDPIVGTVVDGRYRIGPRIARGGMASVYEATDLRLDRACAVKVMHPGLGDDEEFAARFVREARAAARLDHPNVVAVFDQGADDDICRSTAISRLATCGASSGRAMSRFAPRRRDRCRAMAKASPTA